MASEPMRSRMSASEAAAIHRLYHTDPILYMCRQVLVTSLLSGGLQCERRGRPANQAFQALLEQQWIPFVRDLIDNFFMFGFCPVRVVKRSKRGEKDTLVPIVPPYGVYAVDVCVDPVDYTTELRFVPTRGAANGLDVGRTEETEVHMLVCDDGMPNVTRPSFRSRVSTLLPQFLWMQRMRRYALQAEHIRSHPPLITQDSPDKRPVNEALANESFADPSELFEEHEARRYRKNASNLNALLQQRAMTQQNNRNAMGHEHAEGCDAEAATVRLSQTYEDNTYHVPDGTQVAGQAPMPQARTDLVDLERMRVDVICGTFGVPKALIMAESARSNASGANEMDYRSLRRTIESLAAGLARALTETYRLVYGDEAKLTLPFLPLTTVDDVQRVYEAGVISKATQGKYLLLTCGLPLLDLDLQEEQQQPAAKKQRRPSDDASSPGPEAAPTGGRDRVDSKARS